LAVAPGKPQLVMVSPSSRINVPAIVRTFRERNSQAVVVVLHEKSHPGTISVSPEDEWLAIQADAGLVHTLARRFLEGVTTREGLRQFIPVVLPPDSKPPVRLEVVR
jgi:hypothetical protein